MPFRLERCPRGADARIVAFNESVFLSLLGPLVRLRPARRGRGLLLGWHGGSPRWWGRALGNDLGGLRDRR